ncbi:DUF2946 family protein [Herbaspirillum lusitanum]|uniref:DUF2946 family protein n=1 Tax=Herbaspirillum lusitanum TaxID=213312 RepID=A0ABW9A9E3_9BURK
MDEIVRQAMAKWPNVPHCFGWLRLDARGAWRMRDERAQLLNLAGERIVHPALLGFICRNYVQDEQGRWYFQNGPQRVYVDLELTPYIVRNNPGEMLSLQTGEALDRVDAAWMDEEGRLYLSGGEKFAALDDRDLTDMLPLLSIDGMPAGDEALLAWLEAADENPSASGGRLQIRWREQLVDVTRVKRDQLAIRFGFDPLPRESTPAE